jgi:tetratricopeptide (TPR) repeat protein
MNLSGNMFVRTIAMVAVIGFVHAAQADETPHGYGNAVALDDTPRIYDNLGDYSRTITTVSERAQAYFDQGLRLAYGFARRDAARSFRAAQSHDPDCAMCYWGEAWVLGPYQNNPAGVGAHENARGAAQQALDRIEGAEAWEQALIEAMAVRYPDNGEFATEPYAEAMAEAADAHADDPDVRTLHAESLMMFRPWDLHREDNEEVQPYPESREAIAALETVLAQDLAHPGACHLYIHAVEAWEPRRAEACADLLADTIPGVSHIQHMPSHIYVHIGRFGDAVRANEKAVMMDQAAEYDEGFSVYADHNMGMLAFSAWLDGQSRVSLAAARDLGRLNPDDAFHYDLKLARFGRWEEILERDTQPNDGFQAAMRHFARGLAHLRKDESQAASEALAFVRDVRAETPEDATYGFFGHLERDLLGVAEYILAGEIAAADGRVEKAEQSLRRAIALEDGFPYAEPEPWHLPARHVLGAVLLDADRPQDAEAVYREALKVHPDNGWSLRGLEQSLAAQGKDGQARQAGEDFEKAWERADVWLPASRF